MAEFVYDNSVSDAGAYAVGDYVLKKKDKAYIDISLAFTPNPVNGDISVLVNERAINNAIKNIIMFIPSEVPFSPDVGSYTQRYLFDMIDEATAGMLAVEIKRAILFCEPRITFREIDPERDLAVEYRNAAPSCIADRFFQDTLGVFVELQPDQNQFAVTVKYRIIGSEKIYRIQEILTPTR